MKGRSSAAEEFLSLSDIAYTHAEKHRAGAVYDSGSHSPCNRPENSDGGRIGIYHKEVFKYGKAESHSQGKPYQRISFVGDKQCKQQNGHAFQEFLYYWRNIGVNEDLIRSVNKYKQRRNEERNHTD